MEILLEKKSNFNYTSEEENWRVQRVCIRGQKKKFTHTFNFQL